MLFQVNVTVDGAHAKNVKSFRHELTKRGMIAVVKNDRA